MQEAFTFLILLRNLALEKPDQSKINSLIRLCCGMAVNTLQQRYGQQPHLFGEGKDSIEDAAIDAITPLFTARDEDKRPGILHSMELWHTPIETEPQAAWFLNSIILRRTEQHIGMLLKQADPLFGRLLKVISYHIRVNHWAKANHFGTLYIIENPLSVISCPVLDSASLETIPDELFSGRPPAVIQSIFEYIHTRDDYFPAIPLYALIKRLQILNNAQWTEVSSRMLETSGIDETLGMNEIVEIGLEKASERLKNFYIDKNKLTDEEGRLFRLTLRDLAEDMQDGGISRGLYEYLKQHMTDLDQKEFYEKYRPMLDYLLRVMKHTMHEAMQE